MTLEELNRAALTVRLAPEATRMPPSTEAKAGAVAATGLFCGLIVPRKTTGAEPVATNAAFPRV